MDQGPEAISILLVEDNPGDVLLTREALRRSGLSNVLSVVDDGDKAIRYLRRAAGFERSKRPQLILLDLNLPGTDGREVLQEIKADDDLKTIPVVVMTSSDDEADVTRSYQAHANCYVTKPHGMDGFDTVLASIERFWFHTARLPRL
ncbi:MAG: response regulator [Alphaproteobacteria bacterium]